MKQILILTLSVLFSYNLSSQNKADTLNIIKLNEVLVKSNKETSPQQTPVSSTLLNADQISNAQIANIRDISVIVPNFFIPDYGSAMSTTSYIRGYGSRNSGQSIALYVDNVPYFDKSTFDFDFYDINQIEVLRGAQGTLYGRNAMGGIVNIYTLSPFNYQGTKLSISTGNYGFLNAKLSHYAKITDNFGISVGGFYNHDNGFLTNQFTHKSQDATTSAGGRLKLDWSLNPNFKIQYSGNFDFVDQSAFPYGLYDASTGKTALPNYNDPGSYTRSTLTNSLFLQYKNENIVLSSTTSHQYFSDNMKLDNDFSPLSLFFMEQNQKQNALNEEIILRSNVKRDYQWSLGVNGFYQQLNLDAPFYFKKDGLKYILQPSFGSSMLITDTIMKTPGLFNTSTIGGAIFHQSTFNNLLIKGFSLTAGLRIDYEKVMLNYNTGTSLNLNMKMGNQTLPVHLADSLKGDLQIQFSELLPKIALKYEWSNRQFVYANISRGYKAGGFNVQMSADLVSKGLQPGGSAATTPETMMKTISYKPEYSWNYEIGGQCLAFNDRLKSSISLFYININDLQLTQFVPNGLGRKIANAGQAVSKGLELSFDANLGAGFSATLNYGYAYATFSNYTDSVQTINPVTHQPINSKVDYKGKIIPYAPQNTLSLSLNYDRKFKNSCIDQLAVSMQYTGLGKIYWNEANDIAQNFYSLVNAKIGVTKGVFGLDIWAKNLFDTRYNAFYFDSSGSKFFQIGRPVEFGATLKVELR